MFTGIVEEIGQIAAIRKGSASAVLSIQASKVLEGTKIGDSIAVNGICLTVTGMQEQCCVGRSGNTATAVALYCREGVYCY